ncbi:MAG TPA: LuxR C-terminal-related transcriptional regulator [Jatrophihabitans sp.]
MRTRLLDMIDRGVQGPLTLVSAPAGTGKTVAVATWAASGRAPGPVVWLELGDVGIPMSGLWSALVKALRKSGVWVRQKPADAIASMTPQAIGELGAEVAEFHDPVTVILDCDVDLPAEAAGALHRLLAAAAGGLRLVVLSRADPLLPLHRYRLAQSVLEVRTADLAFTTAEARELLLRRGVDLPGTVVESVNQRARGWAAGLLLAAMSMAGSRDPVRSAHELTGATGAVAEYLLAEVLDRQPPAVRDVLLRTSLVEIVQPGLLEVLVGDRGRRALAVLSHGSAFVDEVATMPGWYRYHPLFRDLLFAQLNYETPELAARLRSAAADWYAENGLLDDAVRTAVAAGAWDAAARYVVEDLAVVALIDAGTSSPLRQVASSIPDDVDGVEASLVRAALAFARQQYSTCATHLQRAQERLGPGEADSSEPNALMLATLLMLLASKGSEPVATLRAATNTQKLLIDYPVDRVAARPELSRAVCGTRASAALALGWLEEASEAYESMTKGGIRNGSEHDYVDGIGHLALLAAWRGKIRRAVRLAHQALAVRCEVQQRQDGASAAAEVALGWIYGETQDLSRAQNHIAEAVERGAETSDVFVRVALALTRARIERADGNLSGARSALRAALESGPEDASGDATPRWLADRILVEQARIEILDGRPARADDVLTDVRASGYEAAELVRTEARMLAGRSAGTPDPPAALARQLTQDLTERIDKRLVESQRRLRSGEQAGAIDALDRALRLAAPEHIRRPFLDAPRDLRRLLRPGSGNLAARHTWLTNDRSSPAHQHFDGVARHAKPPAGTATTASPVLIEPLTAKETEVLGYLAQLLTTDEIAVAMYVSVNTIRTHVRNILRKLSASRRNEAIRRARELGILPA